MASSGEHGDGLNANRVRAAVLADQAGQVWRLQYGDRLNNIEQAIDTYKEALLLVPYETWPHDWASIAIDLGAAFASRILGEKSDNLDQAIGLVDQAIRTISPERDAEKWVRAQWTRGIAFQDRINGNAEANLEIALAAYQSALHYSNRRLDPRGYAGVTEQIASVLWARVRDPKHENLKRAIEHCNIALEIHRQAGDEAAIARVLARRANCYRDLVIDGRREVALALADYREALRYRTRARDAYTWALTAYNFAGALMRDDEDPSSVPQAIDQLASALEVFTASNYPTHHIATALALASAYARVGNWKAAETALDEARIASDRLIGLGLNVTGADSTLHQISHMGPLSALISHRLGNDDTAFRNLERGRGRQIALALRLQDAGTSEADRAHLHALRVDMTALQKISSVTRGSERQAAFARLAKAREELAAFAEKALSASTSTNDFTTALTSVVRDGAAVVAPVLTSAGAFVLLAAHGASGTTINSVDLPETSHGKLHSVSQRWLGTTSTIGGKAISPSVWRDAIDTASDEIWDLFAAATVRALELLNVPRRSRLIILPPGGMAVLPIGLARDPETGERLLELYDLSLAPNLASLALRNADVSPAQTLGAIVDPTGNLPFARLEAGLVSALFGSAARATVQGSEAQRGAVLSTLAKRAYWLFSTHGAFDRIDARRSGLQLASGETLALGDLLDVQGLGAPSLVALSACETGLSDTESLPEEFLGLPAGFLRAGAQSVLATLWPVNDFSTALLVSRFFAHCLEDRMAPATALRNAQLWLEDLTVQQLREYTKAALARDLSEDVVQQIQALRRRLATQDPTGKPFAAPYHWGGFVLHGR